MNSRGVDFQVTAQTGLSACNQLGLEPPTLPYLLSFLLKSQKKHPHPYKLISGPGRQDGPLISWDKWRHRKFRPSVESRKEWTWNQTDEFQFYLHHLLAVWPWESGSASLGLSFLSCKMGTMITPTGWPWELRTIMHKRMFQVVPGIHSRYIMEDSPGKACLSVLRQG